LVTEILDGFEDPVALFRLKSQRPANFVLETVNSRLAQRIRSVCFYHVPMHRFDAKIVFDPLNKSQTPDGERFRPAVLSAGGIDFS
jgi:hypothetical protein